jgi:hypothetical protein
MLTISARKRKSRSWKWVHTKNSQTLLIRLIDLLLIIIPPNPPKFKRKISRARSQHNIKQPRQPMHLMPDTPYRQDNKHDTHRYSRKRQIRLDVLKRQVEHEELHRKPDKEEKDEFEETDEDFIVEIVAVDLPVCAKTFKDEPSEIFVDAVGEDDVEDLADCGDDGDCDEDGTEIGVCGLVFFDFVEKICDFENLYPPRVSRVTQSVGIGAGGGLCTCMAE